MDEPDAASPGIPFWAPAAPRLGGMGVARYAPSARARWRRRPSSRSRGQPERRYGPRVSVDWTTVCRRVIHNSILRLGTSVAPASRLWSRVAAPSRGREGLRALAPTEVIPPDAAPRLSLSLIEVPEWRPPADPIPPGGHGGEGRRPWCAGAPKAETAEMAKETTNSGAAEAPLDPLNSIAGLIVLAARTFNGTGASIS